MTSLQTFQEDFLARITGSDDLASHDTASRFERGLAVYRNNYRAALIEATSQTFERTSRWIGDGPFRQAAAHHLILNPPTGWTLDDVGEGFDRTLDDLFPDDPEVGELAWLEWSMHRVFSAPDADPLTAGGFKDATAGFGDLDWEKLRIDFMPRLSTREVLYDLAGLWGRLEQGPGDAQATRFPEPRACHVVREGEQPVFFLSARRESMLIEAMRSGITFGEMCGDLAETMGMEEAALEAGACLGRWLSMGLIRGLITAGPEDPVPGSGPQDG